MLRQVSHLLTSSSGFPQGQSQHDYDLLFANPEQLIRATHQVQGAQEVVGQPSLSPLC